MILMSAPGPSATGRPPRGSSTAAAPHWLDSRRLFGIFILGLLLATGRPAGAQSDYPTKPVRFIVAFSAGTASDTVGRAIADELSKLLGVAVVIENREGAGGNIGHAAAARAAPDGYTLLMGTALLALTVHSTAPPLYDPIKDFVPILRVAQIPAVVVASSAAPFKTWSELVAHAKAKKGAVNFATSGKGGSSHLLAEMLKREFGFDAQDVPYKNAGQAITDTATGTVDYFVANLPPARGLLQSGQLRALAVGSKRRLADHPDVPTFAELTGKPDFEITLWYGLFAPAGTPAAIVARLARAIAQAADTPAVRSRLDAAGGAVSIGSATELALQLRADNTRYRTLLKDLGLLPAPN